MDKKFWQSKKFWEMVAAIVAMIVVAYIPQLESAQNDLIVFIGLVAMAAIGGQSIQDFAREWYVTPERLKQTEQGMSELLKYIEKVTKKDIPDSIQQAIPKELVKIIEDYVGDKPSVAAKIPTANLDRLHFDPAINDEWLGLTKNAKG